VRRGADVLSRIEAITREPGLLESMRSEIVSACDEIIRDLAGAGDIAEITVAGNPAMEHIFLGTSPVRLGVVPYRPAFTEARTLMAADAGLAAAGPARLYAFPLIGGFVGGDAVAAALSLGLAEERGVSLLVDIGTNSEILLSVAGELYATSAAAGPAFEGGGIRYGMSAARGAVRSVALGHDSVSLDVIGETLPKGICGSGLIDAVSGLIKAGVIERSGRIKGRDEVGSNLSDRIREDGSGNSFLLYRGASAEITISQDDVRALQTAKAAIRAGISVLLRRARLDEKDMDRVYIAGAFGSNLGRDGLETIGLLDPAWLEETSAVGDAALRGAALALLDEKKREAEEIAEKTRYVPLSGSPGFESEFIRNMGF